MFVWRRTNFTLHLSRWSVDHTNTTERGVYFSGAGLNAKELLLHLNTSSILKVPRFPFWKGLFKCDMRSGRMRSAGRIPMLGPEQKPTTRMSHLIRKFTQPWELVAEPCLRTETTTKACLLLAKHRMITSYNSGLNCLWKIRPSLLRMVSEQVLSHDSDICESEKIQDGNKH